MAHKELPWELIEEILSCVPPKSLVCFRTVSRKWNILFDDKTFLHNHKSMFQFILTTKSKIYSISINPKVVVSELTLGIPGLESQLPKRLVDCDEFLLFDMDKGAVVWNPWLKHTRVITSQPGLHFEGIRYDGKRRIKKNGYKTIASYRKELDPITYWTIHDFATNVWKEHSNQGITSWLVTTSGVSLNGNLYWVVYHDKTDPLYHLHVWDVSSERFFNFYHLPCAKNHCRDVLVLRVFKGNRFSLLKQCHVTKKIEIVSPMMIWVG